MNDVGEQAEQTEQLANTMLQQVYALLARQHHPQCGTGADAHLPRSRDGAPVRDRAAAGGEAELFDEISPDSMRLAREVVAQFGNLPDEEAWLLSVHFEVAKDNL
jgi:PRD domain protein (TIGR03582 family)